MARYIDADALYKKLYPLDLVDKRLYTINAKAVADAIAKIPAADVVERSECEKWYHEYHVIKDALKQEKEYHRSTEKQIEIERNEMSEIIAKNFRLNDEQYDPSDFEWSAHCLQMEGYHKKREDGKYIRLEDLQQFPIRKDHYDKKHGSEHFVFGVESVIEYAENLPTYNIAPSVDEILPASALFTLAQIEERRQMLMLKHDAELVLDLLSELKKDIHNKAVYPGTQDVHPYINLKVLDGIIQNYINRYYEEGKRE